MQIMQMLVWVHKEFDKACKRCAWGEDSQSRRIHLIDWNTIRSPKGVGGLGLWKAADLTMALLAKLNWRLQTDYERSWCTILDAKYGARKRIEPSSTIQIFAYMESYTMEFSYEGA